MRAILYARSSKDKHGVSTGGQISELRSFADRNDHEVVAQYEDAEVYNGEEGSNRPGLGTMFEDLRHGTVDADIVLLTETSRLSREPRLYTALEYELEKYKVRVQPMNLPTGEGADNTLMKGLFNVLDKHASDIAKERSVRSLKENARNGYVFAGRPPYGYRHEEIPLGIVREGKPVTKKKMVVDEDKAQVVADYLKLRASGTPRTEAKRLSGITLSVSALVSMERNAITYSGALVYGKNRRVKIDGKRRLVAKPRSEWEVYENSHDAIVDRITAEKVMKIVKERSVRVPQGPTLLAGLLVDPDGRFYHSEHRPAKGTFFYRVGKDRSFAGPTIDKAVVSLVAAELTDDDLVAEMVSQTLQAIGKVDVKDVERDIAALDKKIDLLVTRLEEGGSSAVMARLKEREEERARLQAALDNRDEVEDARRAVRSWSPKIVQAKLEFLLSSELIDDPVERAEAAERERQELRSLVHRVVLDPKTRDIRVEYRIDLAGREKLASPTGFEPVSPP